MNDIFITVVIPCYNVAKYVNECLSSVYAQSFNPIQVIVVDNRSEDDTVTQLYRRQEIYKDLQIFTEVKKGACAARNLGLLNAKGTWIQFLDADDLINQYKLAHQIELIKNSSDPSSVLFVAGSYIHKKTDSSESIILPDKDLFQGLLNSKLGITSSNLFNRDYLERIKGWNEQLSSSQEYDLMFRLMQLQDKPNVILDYKPMTIVRERVSGQISQTNPKSKWTRYINLRIQILQYIKINYPELYNSSRMEYHQILFDQLRILAKFDLKLANQLFQTHLPKNFEPNPTLVTTKNYIRLYKILGFELIEKLKSISNYF